MQLGHLMLEALNLMFIGMLCVGVFLGMLVFLIPLLNKIVPDEPVPEAPPSNVTTPLSNAGEQTAVIAAISAAIQQYRNKHQ